MPILLSLLASVVLLGCTSGGPKRDLSESVTQLESVYTLEVTKQSSNGVISSHSAMGVAVGWMDDSCLIATPAHVVSILDNVVESVKVQSWIDNEPAIAQILYIDDKADYALLKSNNMYGCKLIKFDIPRLLIKLGENGMAFGYPKLRINEVVSSRRSVISGGLSMRIKNYFMDGVDALVFDANVSPGFSGGAVFTHDNPPKFLGLIIERLDVENYQNMVMVMPSSGINMLTKKALLNLNSEIPKSSDY